MYIPKHFEIKNWEAITDFVDGVGAVDLVTVNAEGLPVSTLLPAIWDRSALSESNFGTLIMHMAIQNDQWKFIGSGQPALAIVHGPQAYVSPSNYENKKTDHRVVPTWNYQAIHLSGSVTVSQDQQELREIVSQLTDIHEAERELPWRALDANPNYFEGLLKAIVAVRMKITKVEAKAKLSQNRSGTDQMMIIEDLISSKSSPARDVAREMQKNLEAN